MNNFWQFFQKNNFSDINKNLKKIHNISDIVPFFPLQDLIFDQGKKVQKCPLTDTKRWGIYYLFYYLWAAYGISVLEVNYSSPFLGDGLWNQKLSEINIAGSDLLVHEYTIKSSVKLHFMTMASKFLNTAIWLLHRCKGWLPFSYVAVSNL